MTDHTKATVKLELSYHEARLVRSSLLARAKRYARTRQKSNFVPEEGRFDMNEEGERTAIEVAARLDIAITAAIDSLKIDK